MGFSVIENALHGLILLEASVFHDPRGSFQELARGTALAEIGIKGPFVQTNLSVSKKGVLRGLHYQTPPHGQGKLLQVITGSIFDVVVDLRPDSPTYLSRYTCTLNENPVRLLYIPEGLAHGFLALENHTRVLYHCTAEYHKASEGGIRWDDPSLGITWPDLGMEPLVSDKDAVLPFLEDLA